MAETEINFEELAYGYEPRTYIVSKRLNLRKHPSIKAEVIRVMEVGEKVRVVYEGDQWATTEEGYCMKEFLR